MQTGNTRAEFEDVESEQGQSNVDYFYIYPTAKDRTVVKIEKGLQNTQQK